MKKSDLQVYFYTLSKRFDNMLHDPKAQWSDYQRLASDALVVLGRTVEEWPDNEQEYFKAYHNGYDQGRFDEYADRMGKEQSEKVKGKLERQKNCPYCHDEKTIMSVSDDEIVIYIANSLGSQPLTTIFDFSNEAITDEEFMAMPFGNCKKKINYCPMCGRRLSNEPTTEISGV